MSDPRANGNFPLSRRYLGVLAGVALLILVIGIAIRPHDSKEATAPSEGSALQQLSQEAAVRAEAAYLEQRIGVVSNQVVFLPEVGSAVRWSRDTVVTTTPQQPVKGVSSSAAGDTLRIAALGDAPAHGDRLVFVARQTYDAVVSGVAFYGGRTRVRCGQNSYEALVLNAPLQSAFAGGGVFDLGGNRVGLIVRCGSDLVALPVREVERVLREARTPEGVLRERFGLVVTPVDSSARRALALDSGLLVTELDSNARAAGWGIVAGDVILAANNHAVDQPAELVSALNASSGTGVELLLHRAGRPTRIAVTPAPVAPASPSTEETSFSATSAGVRIFALAGSDRLYRAGLRTGDEIMRIGAANNPSVATLQRVTADTSGTPVLVLYRRGTLQRAVILPAR